MGEKTDLDKAKDKLEELKKNVGLKFDVGKTDYDLIPAEALEGIANVFTYGAGKYGPENWKHVTPVKRYLSAAFRHVQAWRKGQTNDEESGLLHLDHAITNLIILRELTILEKQKTT